MRKPALLLVEAVKEIGLPYEGRRYVPQVGGSGYFASLKFYLTSAAFPRSIGERKAKIE